jgi:hypothetical protein
MLAGRLGHVLSGAPYAARLWRDHLGERADCVRLAFPFCDIRVAHRLALVVVSCRGSHGFLLANPALVPSIPALVLHYDCIHEPARLTITAPGI